MGRSKGKISKKKSRYSRKRYTKKRYSRKRYTKKRYSKKRYTKKRYSRKRKLRGGAAGTNMGDLNRDENEALTRIEQNNHYCKRNRSGKRSETECTSGKLDKVCKWGVKDGETDARCMKDQNKIDALRKRRAENTNPTASAPPPYSGMQDSPRPNAFNPLEWSEIPGYGRKVVAQPDLLPDDVQADQSLPRWQRARAKQLRENSLFTYSPDLLRKLNERGGIWNYRGEAHGSSRMSESGLRCSAIGEFQFVVSEDGMLTGSHPTLPQDHPDYFSLTGYIGDDVSKNPKYAHIERTPFLLMKQDYPNKKSKDGWNCKSSFVSRHEDEAWYPNFEVAAAGWRGAGGHGETPVTYWFANIYYLGPGGRGGSSSIILRDGRWSGCCEGSFEAILEVPEQGLSHTTSVASSIADDSPEPEQGLSHTTSVTSSIADDAFFDVDDFEDPEEVEAARIAAEEEAEAARIAAEEEAEAARIAAAAEANTAKRMAAIEHMETNRFSQGKGQVHEFTQLRLRPVGQNTFRNTPPPPPPPLPTKNPTLDTMSQSPPPPPPPQPLPEEVLTPEKVREIYENVSKKSPIGTGSDWCKKTGTGRDTCEDVSLTAGFCRWDAAKGRCKKNTTEIEEYKKRLE